MNLYRDHWGTGSGTVRFFYGTLIKIACPPLPCSERREDRSQVKSRGLILDLQNHPERDCIWDSVEGPLSGSQTYTKYHLRKYVSLQVPP